MCCTLVKTIFQTFIILKMLFIISVLFNPSVQGEDCAWAEVSEKLMNAQNNWESNIRHNLTC